MPYTSLKFPPGMYHQGTVYDAKGRWYDGNLTRFRDGVVQPWGGWTTARASTGAGARITTPVRGMHNAKTTAQFTKLYAGVANSTQTKIFVFFTDGATMNDITPAVAPTNGNLHGNSDLAEASCWIFDEFPRESGGVNNPDVLAVMAKDGVLYTDAWTSPTSAMTAVSGAPTGQGAVVVTPERFVMLLGWAAGPAVVSWSDQDNITTWTAGPTNQAGELPLPGAGWLMNGKRGRGETLLWTDQHLYAARYIGGDLVYSIVPVGFQCGAISRRSMAMVDGKGVWMGNNGFFMYDGFVRQLPCEVSSYIFGRLNLSQRSKVAAVPSPETNEVIWFYPSGSSATGECDSIVAYNYVEGHWALGFISRTDGVERRGFNYPTFAGASGALYYHENGTTYAEEDASTLTPYIESGPFEIGEGDRTMMVRRYIPDENTLGNVNLTLLSRIYPTASETTNGPYTAANPTNVRISARQVRAKFTQVSGGWRVGTPRLEVTPRGLR